MLHPYLCPSCGAADERLAALDDHTARCLACQGSMNRLTPDPLGVWLKENERELSCLRP